MLSTRLLLVIAGLTLLIASSAKAQPPAPVPVSPPFSPYLNLLRGGGSPTLNYYGLVRPAQAFNQSVQGIQANVAANNATLNDLSSSGVGLPTTGVFVAGYQNHNSYFLNQSSSAGYGRSGAGSIGAGNGNSSAGVNGFGGGGVGGVGGAGVGGAGVGNRPSIR